MNLPNFEISRLIRGRLQEERLTLLECCDAFNAKYSKEIEANDIRPLNKDFLSRTIRNDFKVCTTRISKLCEFLDIHEARSARDPLQVLSDQVREFTEQASNDAKFRSRYSAVEKFLSGLNFEKLFDEY